MLSAPLTPLPRAGGKMAPGNNVKGAEQKLWGECLRSLGAFLLPQSILPVITPSFSSPQALTSSPSPKSRLAEVSVPASPHLHSPL